MNLIVSVSGLCWIINKINSGSESNCKDAKDSKLANTIPNLWQKSPIKWSSLACDIENKKRYGKN